MFSVGRGEGAEGVLAPDKLSNVFGGSTLGQALGCKVRGQGSLHQL